MLLAKWRVGLEVFVEAVSSISIVVVAAVAVFMLLLLLVLARKRKKNVFVGDQVRAVFHPISSFFRVVDR